MFLYLVQHAKAKSEQEDPARPLSDKGIKDIKKTASFISSLNLNIDEIIHSGKLRAKQTAEILSESLKVKNLIVMEGLSPLDEPEIIAEKIINAKNSLMIVGHLPHLSKLASFLLCGDKNKKIISFQMGGIVCLQRDEESWSLKWMITPAIIEK